MSSLGGNSAMQTPYLTQRMGLNKRRSEKPVGENRFTETNQGPPLSHTSPHHWSLMALASFPNTSYHIQHFWSAEPGGEGTTR